MTTSLPPTATTESITEPSTPSRSVEFPTPLPDGEVTQHCLTIENQSSKEGKIHGNLLLGNRLPGNEPYLLNLESNLQTKLSFSISNPRLWLDFAAVSPKGNWLAYIELFEGTNVYRLHILSSDLQKYSYLDLQDGWGKIVNWLDEERLLISTSVSSLPKDIFPTGRMAILNPFSKDWKILSPTLPAPISTDPMPWYYWPDNPIVIYNPSLSRAIYLSIKGFLLIDAQSQDIISKINTSNYMSLPRWSPNGNNFAMVIDVAEYPVYKSEIYQIDSEGQSTPITHLNKAFGNNNVGIESFQWSPDGNKIAFTYFVNDMMTNEHFAVVDIGTGQTIDYCLPSVGSLPPIWSSDSNQIAFASATNKDLDREVYWRTVVVDIKNEFALQVAETMLPLGWMISP